MAMNDGDDGGIGQCDDAIGYMRLRVLAALSPRRAATYTTYTTYTRRTVCTQLCAACFPPAGPSAFYLLRLFSTLDSMVHLYVPPPPASFPHTHTLHKRNFTTSVIFSSVFPHQLVCSKVTLQVMSNAPVVALVIDSRHTFIRFVSIMYGGLCLSTKPCKLMLC